MADDPILLMLVIDDSLAPKILAWWKAESPKVIEANKRIPDICRMIGASEARVRASLGRCQAAGLLLDGGISDMGEKWVGTLVGKRLGAKKQRAGN